MHRRYLKGHFVKGTDTTESDVFPRSAVIFGGSGFIGTHLARLLLKNGTSVTTVDRIPRNDALECDHRVWDLKYPIPRDLATPPEVIFNLAAVHRTPGHPDRDYYETNVAGALHVTQWAGEVGVECLCLASSIAVYGPSESAITESSPLRPVTPYGISKMMAEHIHNRWSDESPNRTLTIARPAVVFGLGERGNFTRLSRALRQRRFVYPGRADTIKACGYVEDLVGAMCFSLSENPPLEVFNFCYPETITIRDVCEAFQDVAGYRPPQMLPESLLKLPMKMLARAPISTLSQQAARIRKLTQSTNVRPLALENAGFQWQTDLRTGISQWFAESGSREFR
jgi:nucleoside-diphosphate-sugar epimerase